GTTPNFLYAERDPGDVGGNLRTPMTSVLNYNVTIIASGPMKTVLQATYTFTRPRYAYGQVSINSAGTGHYTITLTLYAGSKSILIDEDSDMQFSYYLPLFNDIMPVFTS